MLFLSRRCTPIPDDWCAYETTASGSSWPVRFGRRHCGPGVTEHCSCAASSIRARCWPLEWVDRKVGAAVVEHLRLNALAEADGTDAGPPLISPKYSPYPPRITVRSVRPKAKPVGGARLFTSFGRSAPRNRREAGPVSQTFPRRGRSEARGLYSVRRGVIPQSSWTPGGVHVRAAYSRKPEPPDGRDRKDTSETMLCW